jgi:hypothetical protein
MRGESCDCSPDQTSGSLSGIFGHKVYSLVLINLLTIGLRVSHETAIPNSWLRFEPFSYVLIEM